MIEFNLLPDVKLGKTERTKRFVIIVCWRRWWRLLLVFCVVFVDIIQRRISAT